MKLNKHKLMPKMLKVCLDVNENTMRRDSIPTARGGGGGGKPLPPFHCICFFLNVSSQEVIVVIEAFRQFKLYLHIKSLFFSCAFFV